MIVKLFGMGILVGCLYIVFMFETASSLSGALRIFHWPAILLTGCGPIGLVLMSANWKMLFQTLGVLLGKSPEKRQKKHDKEAIYLQRLGDAYYNEGPSAFDDVQVSGMSDFVQKVIERLSVRMPIGDIRHLLEVERDRVHTRLMKSFNMVGIGVKLSPSVGMLGTILGMVQLLSTLSDPSQIGSKISLALFTTFYGLFFSLAIWSPIQQKVERIIDVEIEGYSQVIKWLEFLEKRKPGDYFADTAELPTGESRAA